MKGVLEEYGGMILAAISGLSIIAIVVLLYSTGNPIGDGFRDIIEMGLPK